MKAGRWLACVRVVLMTLEQSLIEAVRSLSAEQQQELLDHANRLREEHPQQKAPLESIKGLWAGMGISLSAKEIDEARREMWKDFPREDI